MPPKVVSNVGAKVSCKVVAAHVIGAAGEVTVELGVESQVLAANSSHYIPAEFLAKFTTVNRVEIIKDRTIGSLSKKGGTALRIKSATCPPGYFASKTNVVL